MIGVIGLGYVGSTSLLAFHKMGAKVVGFDIAHERIESIQSGVLPIHDREMEEYLKLVRGDINVSASFTVLSECREVLICVPTDYKNGKLDLSIVREVISQLNKMPNLTHIWIRSTIDDPNVFHALGQDSNAEICSYPEFLREGKCWVDFFDPPLCLIGGQTAETSLVYKTLSRQFEEVITCSQFEAITVKLISNTFHALKVVFANELKHLSWASLVDLKRVMEIFASDKKLNISPAYLKPGLPFGGPCLPKDSGALAQSLDGEFAETGLISAIGKSNYLEKQNIIRKLLDLPEKRIGIWGAQFKKGTGDFRNSPIIQIISEVCHAKNVTVFDEMWDDKESVPASLDFASSLEELIEKSDVVFSYNSSSNSKIKHWDCLDVAI